MKTLFQFVVNSFLVLITFKNSTAQPTVLVNQKLLLTTEYLNTPQFNKRFGDAFRSCKTKHCEFDKTIRFGAVLDGDSIIVVLDNYKTGTKPFVKKISKTQYTPSVVQNFINNYLLRLTSGEYCDRCVNNFVSYYSNYVTNMNNFNKSTSQYEPIVDNNISSIVLNVKVSGSSQVVPFPSCVYNNTPCTTYNVTSGDANQQHGGTIYLPDNFLITVEPDVQLINWNFSVLSFGVNAEIDLSHRNVPIPSTPGTPHQNNNPNFTGDCSSGYGGGSGASGPIGITGGTGGLGLSGTNLIFNADAITDSGALWIRTDGTPGGIGGTGGQGGKGDAGNCDNGTDAGPGGDGGYGGVGGTGGNVSQITFTTLDQNGNPTYYLPSPSNGIAPSTRPGGVSGTQSTGLIAIYGNPGSGGPGGYGGPPGQPAGRCGCRTGRNVYDCASHARKPPCPPRISRVKIQASSGADGIGVPQ